MREKMQVYIGWEGRLCLSIVNNFGYIHVHSFRSTACDKQIIPGRFLHLAISHDPISQDNMYILTLCTYNYISMLAWPTWIANDILVTLQLIL